MESLAQRVTALTFELRPQFREAIRVKVGSYSAVWMNREISVLLRPERGAGSQSKQREAVRAAYD